MKTPESCIPLPHDGEDARQVWSGTEVCTSRCAPRSGGRTSFEYLSIIYSVIIKEIPVLKCFANIGLHFSSF